MAKKLEETLYKSAPTFQEYKDESTLKSRLQQLAMKINPKNSANIRNKMPVVSQPGQGRVNITAINPIVAPKPDQVVSKGAALLAAIKSGQIEDKL